MVHKLGLARIVDPITESAYEQYELAKYQNHSDQITEGQKYPRATAFHAAVFPGDDPMACGRKAIYELLDTPQSEPTDPGLRLMGDVGKFLELELIKRWHEVGVLLSAVYNDQTYFEFPDWWLTGHADAVILPPDWNRPHIVEIKSRKDSAIEAMKFGVSSYLEDHRKQLLAYISGFNLLSKKFWPDLERVKDGTLYYISRDKPRNTFEYYFELDKGFFDKGVLKLLEWQEAFLNEELPERPKEWRWTLSPCQWCPYKRDVCRKDEKDKVTDLSKSLVLEYSKNLREGWDYDENRERVIERWRNSK